MTESNEDAGKTYIGFIGTGIMGSRMAANLISNGYNVTVYNRTKDKVGHLIESGAKWAQSPAIAAQQSDYVITMLAHPDAVEAAALGDKTGFLRDMKRGAVWIDCSTVNPMFAKRMAQETAARGVRYLDAPVAGSKNQAENAQLVFFVGGDEAVMKEVQPLFEVMGKAMSYVGKHGMGNALKLVVNHLLATSMIAFAEGMALGESLGLSQERLLNTLIGGAVTPPYLAGKRAKIENGDYEAEFPLRWIQKDMHMVAETAYASSTAMPLANVTKEIFQLAVQQGYGDQDFSSIYEFLSHDETK